MAMNQSIMFTLSTFINKNHVDLMFWNSFDYCLPIGRRDLSQLHSLHMLEPTHTLNLYFVQHLLCVSEFSNVKKSQLVFYALDFEE